MVRARLSCLLAVGVVRFWSFPAGTEVQSLVEGFAKPIVDDASLEQDSASASTAPSPAAGGAGAHAVGLDDWSPPPGSTAPSATTCATRAEAAVMGTSPPPPPSADMYISGAAPSRCMPDALTCGPLAPGTSWSLQGGAGAER